MLGVQLGAVGWLGVQLRTVARLGVQSGADIENILFLSVLKINHYSYKGFRGNFQRFFSKALFPAPENHLET